MDLETQINEAFQRFAKSEPATADPSLEPLLEQVLDALEGGEIRIAEKKNGHWQVNHWVKKAVLLCFQTYPNRVSGAAGLTYYFDKLPLRFSTPERDPVQGIQARIVPPAAIRRGAHIGARAVIMPSYINIGAFIGAGSMVDTWATVGSGAQIGCNVHLSGGAGIGGVLEPLQAMPTIIEDDCFIGARSEIVEGVIVERGSVISMGVFIGQSTPIYDRESRKILRGRVPAGSVVVPGSLPAADGSHSLYAAIIVKTVDRKTRAKVAITELLRDTG